VPESEWRVSGGGRLLVLEAGERVAGDESAAGAREHARRRLLRQEGNSALTTIEETLSKLHGMRLGSMATAVREVLETSPGHQLSFEEKPGIVVDREWTEAPRSMVEVVWTEPALSDRDAVADYVALDKPDPTRKLVKRVLEMVEHLQLNPKLGARPPELKGSRYRQLDVAPWRIFYRLDGEHAYILHVLRSERPLRATALAKRQRALQLERSSWRHDWRSEGRPWFARTCRMTIVRGSLDVKRQHDEGAARPWDGLGLRRPAAAPCESDESERVLHLRFQRAARPQSVRARRPPTRESGYRPCRDESSDIGPTIESPRRARQGRHYGWRAMNRTREGNATSLPSWLGFWQSHLP